MPLTARAIGVGYPGGPEILHEVDLEVPAGRFVCLLGPNGTGKSTLLRTLAGLLAPRQGRVELDGTGVAALSASSRAKRIGFLPQEIQPAFAFDVEEVVALGARVAGHGKWYETSPSGETRAAVARALTAVDAAHLAERPFSDLSGGERRRVLVASVLAQEPEFLLLDEPAAMLDLQHQATLFDLLRGLARDGLGVLCVTHDANLAATFADEIVLLHEGRVAVRGDAHTVLADEYLTRLFGDRYELLRVDGRPPVVLPRG